MCLLSSMEEKKRQFDAESGERRAEKPKPETLILDVVAPGPALIQHLVIDNQTKFNILSSDGVSSSIPPLHHGRVDMEVVREYIAKTKASTRASTAVVKLSLPKKMSSSWEDVGVAVASMVLATFSMFDKPENVFLITFTGAPCFPISAIASPNSPTVEANFCRIPATLSTLDDGIFNAATGG
nr:zinc finger BED domain-containing protein RICESLEEPER 2-like [Ipomoea batatas]